MKESENEINGKSYRMSLNVLRSVDVRINPHCDLRYSTLLSDSLPM